MYFNCRSLLPKIDELAALCSANKPDVVCLVETWLCMDILDMERYKHADFDKANKLLCDMDLDKILNADIQTKWKRFRSAFLDVMKQCIPRSVLRQEITDPG